MIIRMTCLAVVLSISFTAANGQNVTRESLEALARAVEQEVIEWRRDIHANPELGNRELRTADLVAGHLADLGLEVTTGIAHTGVVGILRGARSGPVVALRADMDALPVTEQVDLPFASRVRTVYNDQDVGVMHACGHDTHVAMLMGVAQALASLRDDLAGTVMFIFQPAEEGAPEGEEGGAELMLEEGIFDSIRPDAIFALHVIAGVPSGVLGFRAGPALASADTFRITVKGSQTHGAYPWNGVDPIVTASQIVLATQTIMSRQINISELPAVVSFGTINGGVRTNIIPDAVTLSGTIRTYDLDTKATIHERLSRTANSIAESAGATADVEIDIGYPPTVNDASLVGRTRETLTSALGAERVIEIPRQTAAEDFSYFANEVPGLMMLLGVTPHDVDPVTAAPNHSPLFYVDESALVTGVQAMLNVTTAYLDGYTSP